MTPVAVGFDFDHTLGLDHSLERKAFGVVAADLGTPIDVEEPAMKQLIEELLVPFRRAILKMPAMLAAFAASLPGGAEACGESPADLAERYREACYGLVDELVVPMDGARACVDAFIAEGIPVGILTNGWSPLQERKIARVFGAFPGPVLVSDAIGAYKPSRLAFAHLEQALNCTAETLWYVGDNPEVDILGAHAHGVRAVWIDWEGQTYPANVPPPDARIAKLAELPAVIRGS